MLTFLFQISISLAKQRRGSNFETVNVPKDIAPIAQSRAKRANCSGAGTAAPSIVGIPLTHFLRAYHMTMSNFNGLNFSKLFRVPAAILRIWQQEGRS